MTFAFPDPTTWPYPEHYLLLPDGRLHRTQNNSKRKTVGRVTPCAPFLICKFTARTE
jgi:hypothetical protein